MRSGVGQDDRHPENYIIGIFQGGTGLPDRDMYLVDNDKMAAIRKAYVAYLAQMLTLAGEPNAQARADAVMALETAIAKVQWTREDSSDAIKTYNKFTLADTARLSSPTLDVAAYLRGTSPKITELLVSQPTAIKGIADILDCDAARRAQGPALINSLRGFSDYLPKAIDDANFAFFGTTLQGTPQQQERWRRGVGFVEGVLGEDVGKIYAERHFPAEYKASMNVLVKNVLDAMGRPHRHAGLDAAGDQAARQGQARQFHRQGRLSRPVARLWRPGGQGRRPVRQCGALEPVRPRL